MKNQERTTDIWIVINDETLNTMKGKGGKTAKFATEQKANEKASEKLNSWSTVNIKFTHRFLQHKI